MTPSFGCMFTENNNDKATAVNEISTNDSDCSSVHGLVRRKEAEEWKSAVFGRRGQRSFFLISGQPGAWSVLSFPTGL